MRIKTVGAVSALALFAGLGSSALAQAPGGGQERLQAPGQQMAPGQQETTPGQRIAPGQKGTTPGQRAAPGQQETAPGQQRGQAQQQRERTQRQQAEQPDRKQPQRAEQPDRKQPQRAEQPDRKQPQRAEQPDRERQRAQEPTRRDRQQAEEPQRRDRERAEQPEQRDRQRAEQPDGRQQAERPDRPQVTEQQRTTVVQRFRESGAIDRARVTDVDINISVGTRVPRDRIRLAPLPAVIVQEVPAYRGYVFFVVRDEIVIVEPSTYVIVDVIRLDGAPARAARAGGRLTLTSEQRQIVLSHIDLRPEVRLGIGGVSIGMSVPQAVELRTFPQAVIEDVPELEGYRYFVFEDEVAVVDPDARQIVVTISE